jgi:hypothetical protein
MGCRWNFVVIRLAPSRLKPVLQGVRIASASATERARVFSGTGFSREEARMHTLDFAV